MCSVVFFKIASSYNSLDQIFGVDSISIGHEDEIQGVTDLRHMFDTEGNMISNTLSSYGTT